MHLNPRRVVLIGLLVAQIAMVGALMAVSGRLTEKAESTHTDALLDTATAEAVDHLRAHIAPAESVVDLMSQLGAEVGDPLTVFNNTFLEALRRTPQLDGIYIGTSEGASTYTSRDDDGYRLRTITITDQGPETELQYMDASGTITEIIDGTDDDYDPRERVWYSDAISNPGSVVWTDPYVFFTSQVLGITAARTIERDGEVVGVVGADIELGSLSTFVNNLQVGDRGGAVIFNQAGTAIAFNDASLLQVETEDGFRTVNIDEFEHPNARAAVASLTEDFSDGSALTEFESLNDGALRAAFRSISVGSGRWTIGVYGPKNNFTGVLSDARSRERWLVLGVGALTGLVFFGLIALPVTRPINDLADQASTDALTRLPNRRKILALAQEASDNDRPVAFAMVDVDNFKTVNDTRGHQTGDQVLQVIARRIKSTARDSALVGRIGGEEFLVVFPDTRPESAQAACERIRESIAASPISTSGERIPVTVSIGVATATGRANASELTAVADEALRYAKSNGKNQVRCQAASSDGPHGSADETSPAPERV